MTWLILADVECDQHHIRLCLMKKTFLFGCLCEIYDSLLPQLAGNNTCPMQGVQTHPAHIITSKAPVKTINKNAASSNNKPKNKTHWNLAPRRAQNSFGFFQMSNNTCTCCILFHDFLIPPPLAFPHVRIFFVFLLSAILSKFCCKPSGRKHVSLHGLQLEKLEWILPKKDNNDKEGNLFAISMTNASIVLQWPHLRN